MWMAGYPGQNAGLPRAGHPATGEPGSLSSGCVDLQADRKGGPYLGHLFLAPHTQSSSHSALHLGMALHLGLPSSQDLAPHLTLLTTLGKAPPCQCFYVLGFNNDDNNLLST